MEQFQKREQADCNASPSGRIGEGQEGGTEGQNEQGSADHIGWPGLGDGLNLACDTRFDSDVVSMYEFKVALKFLNFALDFAERSDADWL
jgi:hypothetical protein